MNESLLVFVVGLIVGAGGMHLFDIYKKDHSDDIQSEDTTAEADNVTIVDGELKPVGAVGDIYRSTSSFVDINDRLEDVFDIDKPKLEAGKPLYIHGGEITTGTVNLGTSRIKLDAENKKRIVEVTLLDFMRAVTSGSNMVSFIYDPSNGNLCWNDTWNKAPLSDEEIVQYLTLEVWTDIVKDLELKKKYDVLPFYFYDTENDVYIKVE